MAEDNYTTTTDFTITALAARFARLARMAESEQGDAHDIVHTPPDTVNAKIHDLQRIIESAYRAIATMTGADEDLAEIMSWVGDPDCVFAPSN
jgi:hypothetical protein